MVTFGEDENLCTYVMNLVSDNIPSGSQRIEAYERLVQEFALLDFEDTLFAFGDDPLDEDLAYVLFREGYTDVAEVSDGE